MAKNRLLKKPGTVSEYTPALIQELIKCSTDAIYFIQTYCKIVHPTKGLIPFTLYDFQKDIISAYVSNRYNILCSARQSGKSQISCVYLLHYAMFHPNSTILIVSNKASGAKEMVHRISTSYEYLPDWLRPAIDPGDWNKLSISFDNGSKIIAEATTPQSGRGLSVSLLFWDEMAWASSSKNSTDESLDRALWTSLSPVLAQGGSAILASTPNGDDNLFAEIWHNAYYNKNNGFHAVFVPWNAVPGRDEKFKEAEIAKISRQKWDQEYECKFISSDPILIDSTVLVNYKTDPLPEPDAYGFNWFDTIKPNGNYILAIDPATGSGGDYTVMELYSFPQLNQIAEFRSNISYSSSVYQSIKILLKMLQKKGAANCYWSFENNAVGEGLVALYESDNDPIEFGDLISDSGKNRIGINTNKSKMKTCLSLKELFEGGRLHIKSSVVLSELRNFVKRGSSYSGRLGSHDDTISAHLILIRILEEIITYEDNAHAIMHQSATFESDEIEEEYVDDALPIISSISSDYLFEYQYQKMIY